MTEVDQSALVEAALTYAARGWPVHAIIDGKGRTLGYESRDGVRWGSTTDPDTIRAWRSQRFIKVGVPTGAVSGLLVLDVDDEAVWSALCAEVGANPNPHTLSQRTGRDGGGRQFVFEYPAGDPLGNSSKAFPAGIDVRGEGGQFVAPPSIHESGRVYAWVDPAVPVAPLPGWLLERLREADPYVAPAESYDGPPATKWGAAAMAAELAQLEATTENRNDRFYLAACRLSEIANGGHVEWAQAERELRFAALGTGLEKHEVTRSLGSARKKTEGKARGPKPSEPAPVAPARDRDDDDLDPDSFFEKREGLIVPTLAAAAEAGTRIRRGIDGNLWRYDSGVYSPDGDEYVSERVRELLGDKWKKRHPAEVLGYFGAGLPEIGVDQPEDLINVANGLLDWRTGELRPHDDDVLSTIQIPIAWNPDATCPRIERFFGEVVPDAVEFMFEVFGYAIYPKLPIHKALLLFGPGRNGKGTTLRLLERFVGKPNVANVPLQTFGERVFAAATVYGKLINLAGDLDARDMARSDAFKMLTGGDSVYAEHKFKPPFAFTSYALLVFAANEAPISRDQTEGYFSRWLIVPFLNRYVGANDDTKLDSKLQSASELEGLLVRAVLGLRALLERGYFDEPGSVQEAGESYRTKLDSVAGFVDDECTLGEECQVYRSDLYRRYVAWSADNGRRPLNSATFYEHVRNRYGATDHKSGGKRFIRGIGFAALTHDAFGDDA